MEDTCQSLLLEIERLLKDLIAFNLQAAATDVNLVSNIHLFFRNTTYNLFRTHIPGGHWNSHFEGIICNKGYLEVIELCLITVDKYVNESHIQNIRKAHTALKAMLANVRIELEDQELCETARAAQLYRMFLEIMMDPTKRERLKKMGSSIAILNGNCQGYCNFDNLDHWLKQYSTFKNLMIEHFDRTFESFYDYIHRIMKRCIDDA
jgi:hypothetical protein